MLIPRRYRQLLPDAADAGVPGPASGVLEHHALALRRFDQVMAARGLARNTRRLYGAAVGRWLAFGGHAGHLDPALALRWIGERRRAGCAQSTINMDVKAMRAYYRAQHVMGGAGAGEAAKAPRLRRPVRRLVRAYSLAEVATLLQAPPADTWTGARDRLLLRVLWETGLRGGELAALELGDLLPDGFVFVTRGKGARDRYVPISAALQAALMDWTSGRRREARPGKRAVLFVTRRGRGLAGAGAVWRIVSRYARAALGTACGFYRLRGARGAVAKPWSGHYPHLLRASLATALSASGMPINAVAEMLGHASIESTAHYVAVDLDGLRDAVHKNPRLKRR